MSKFKESLAAQQSAGVSNARVEKPVKSYFTTAKIAYIAMFVAINVVVGAISPRIGSLKVTLTYTVCFIAGYFFGPLAGGLTGGRGDILGTLLSGNAPNPIILLGNVLLGLIPGLISLIKIPKFKKATPYLGIAISYILVYVVCTLLINTYGLYLLGMGNSNSFWVYVGIRAGTQTPIVAANLALTFVAYPLFERVFKAIKK